jgi:hypothetical protein
VKELCKSEMQCARIGLYVVKVEDFFFDERVAEDTAQIAIDDSDGLHIYIVRRQDLASWGGVMSGCTSFVSATRSDDVGSKKPYVALLIGYAAVRRCLMSKKLHSCR